LLNSKGLAIFAIPFYSVEPLARLLANVLRGHRQVEPLKNVYENHYNRTEQGLSRRTIR